MSLNLFGKTYLAPDYLYDNGYDRILFSKERNQAEYLNYESFDFPGLSSAVLKSTASVLDLVNSGEFESIAHYIKNLYDNNIEARIYADDESWFLIFFTWLRIAFPNITDKTSFILYNLNNQRETLVFADNREFRTFTAARTHDKNQRVFLTKQEFIDKFAEFKKLDTVTDEYYNEVRLNIKTDFCLEIQLASYLSGRCGISTLVEKIKIIGSKIVFNIVDDIRDYIRENLMTEQIQTLTGVVMSWEDQNWKESLVSRSSDMSFLFDYSTEALQNDSDYRLNNINFAIYWCQWIIDNTAPEDINNPDLGSIITACQWAITHKDCFSSDDQIAQSSVENLIQEDVNFTGTTISFQQEYSRDKINTFLIEYVYQMAKSNDNEGLKELSHT
jgi:hypothetical protein